RPAGSRSATFTLVALSGPALLRAVVRVIVSPTFGETSLIACVSASSTCCGVATIDAVSGVVGSFWSLYDTVAVLVCGLGLTTAAVIVNVAESPLATLSRVQSPLAPSQDPRLGGAETNARPAGRRSDTSTLVAASGPPFESVRVKVIVS